MKINILKHSERKEIGTLPFKKKKKCILYFLSCESQRHEQEGTRLHLLYDSKTFHSFFLSKIILICNLYRNDRKGPLL